MKKDSIVKTLEDFGLTENESRVYFAALSLGPSTIQKIANAAEIRRTTVYGVIESLQKLGLVKVEVRGFKKAYTAESPERLERIIEQKKERLQNQLPDLLSLFNQKGGESFIKYYEGKEAVKSVYESNIRDIMPGEEYMVVSHSDKVFDIYGEWFTRFVERRGKLNINIRMILQDTPPSRDYKKHEKNYNHTIRFLPEKANLTTNLVITPQRVLIHQLNPPIMGIVIENHSAIQMHQQLFEIMWETCEKN